MNYALTLGMQTALLLLFCVQPPTHGLESARASQERIDPCHYSWHANGIIRASSCCPARGAAQPPTHGLSFPRSGQGGLKRFLLARERPCSGSAWSRATTHAWPIHCTSQPGRRQDIRWQSNGIIRATSCFSFAILIVGQCPACQARVLFRRQQRPSHIFMPAHAGLWPKLPASCTEGKLLICCLVRSAQLQCTPAGLSDPVGQRCPRSIS